MPRITDLSHKTYIAVLQCHIVTERCPGYFCEHAFHHRQDGFATLPPDVPGESPRRVVYLTCGGCCGRAMHRKLASLIDKAQKTDHISREQIVVTFASCITRDNYHAPPCPHLDYLIKLVEKLHLDYSFDTHLSRKAQQRRDEGIYES